MQKSKPSKSQSLEGIAIIELSKSSLFLVGLTRDFYTEQREQRMQYQVSLVYC